MKRNLFSIYNRLQTISNKTVKSNNNINPIYKYNIDSKSKKSEIIKGINEIVDYLNNPEYAHIYINSFKKQTLQQSFLFY